jgi:hypothetical protein
MFACGLLNIKSGNKVELEITDPKERTSYLPTGDGMIIILDDKYGRKNYIIRNDIPREPAE